MGGGDCPLSHLLTDQEEIISERGGRGTHDMFSRSCDCHMTHMPLRVMVWSTTVPGGGLSNPRLVWQKILVEILFCTTTTAILGW